MANQPRCSNSWIATVFFESLKTFAKERPVFGTCAGAILLAKDVRNPAQRSLGILDIAVERNAYGRQIDSAILMLETSLPGPALETVFIRAPRILATGDGVETLASRDGFAVLVRQGQTLAATFHPELSADRRVHQFFADLVREAALVRLSSVDLDQRAGIETQD